MQTYIHYGADSFVKEKFEPVKNRRVSNKPFGGLWASDVAAKYGWRKWVERNDHHISSQSFTFELSPEARIFVIDSSEKAKKLPERETDQYEIGIHTTYPVLPDFEKLATEYDVIDFRISEDRTLYHTLYTWDCDSILVLNPDVIIPISKIHAQ